MEDFQAQIVERRDIEAVVSVEVPQKTVSNTFKNVMQSLTRQVRIPGFRPGKAPRRVILSQIGGEEVLQQEVYGYLVDHFIPLAVEELELRPINVESANDEPDLPQPDETFTFQFTCELFPEITLPDYRTIVIDQGPEEVSEELVDDFIDDLRERFAILEPIEERSVQADDTVILGLQSSPEGSNGLPLDLRTASDMIIEQLVGKEIDEAFELVLDIPRKEKPTIDEIVDDAMETLTEVPTPTSDNVEAENHEAESHVDVPEGDAAASDVAPVQETDGEDNETEPTLAVFVQHIYEKLLPERDDEFAETLGQDSWEQVEQNIRNNLQREHDSEIFQTQMDEFVEKLLELTEVTIPSRIMENARHNTLARTEARLKEDGWTMREYRKALEEAGDLEEFEMEVQARSYKAAKQDMVLNALLEAEETELEKGEFEQLLERAAQEEDKSLRKFKKELGEEGIANYHYLVRRNRSVYNVVREILDVPSDESEA